MAKLRSTIAQFSTASERASERQKANGSRSFLEYAGHTGRPRSPYRRDSILLADGTEVITPFDICMPTLRTEIINGESTKEKIVGKLRAN